MATTRKSLNKQNSICFVAGKSAGHILPCITLAHQFLGRYPHYTMVFFTTHSALDGQLVAQNPIIKQHIPLAMRSLQLKKIYKAPLFLWDFIQAFCVSFYHLKKIKPESIISSGGVVSIPVCLAAKLLSIPIELYELNVVPGKTIKFLAPLAYKIWVCFSKSISYLPAHKCALTDYPIKFIDTHKVISQESARMQLGLSAERKTLLILGGSQGSLFINRSIKQLLESNQIDKNAVQIIHQTGSQDTTNWHEFYTQQNIPALVFAYTPDLESYYAAADLIICRSGAGTLAEVSFFNKRCITIPLEADTTLHQIDNALAVAEKQPQLFKVVRQKEIQANNKLFAEEVVRQLQ